jgi:hypothetical protein
MTQPNEGSLPGDETTRWSPPTERTVSDPPATADPAAAPAPEPTAAPSTFEAVDDGPIVRREPVTTDAGTSGDTAAARRASGIRWAVALGGVAVVVAATIAIVALASGRPATSVAVGYMPEDTLQYTEYRFDLPGDQRQKLAAFMAHFPGFDDQAIFDQKLDEVLDRILVAASNGEQAWTRDIKPWFGGVIAMGGGPLTAESAMTPLAGMAMSPLSGAGGLVVVTVKDPTLAASWVQNVIGEGATTSSYGDATLITGPGGGQYVIGINGEAMLAGPDAAVRAAIDSKGDGKLADDAEFRAAFETVGGDYVSFGYFEVRAYVESALALASGSGSTLDQTTVDDEIVSMIPAWQSSVLRVEAASLVGESTYPSIDFGFAASNKQSSLAGHAPAGTIAYAEVHDVGAALNALLERLRGMADLREAFAQFDQAVGMVGGVDALIGWWGDAAIAVTELPDGSLGGGLLVTPTDAEQARQTFGMLRSFIVFGGGQAGIEIREVDHGGTPISIIDFSQAAGADLPPGVKPEIAYAVRDDVVVIGYGEDWVKSVLDAGPGASLADDGRYKAELARVGAQNIGLAFVDITAVRELIEPLVEEQIAADEWEFYETEILPYVRPFDALVSGARKDGSLDHISQTITVK